MECRSIFLAILLCAFVRLSASQMLQVQPQPDKSPLVREQKPEVTTTMAPETAGSTGCPRQCQPAWIGLLRTYERFMPALSPQQPVCMVANQRNVLDPCVQMGSMCKPPSRRTPAFYCCPNRCLYSVTRCLPPRRTRNTCIPSDISYIQAELQQAFMSAGRPGRRG